MARPNPITPTLLIGFLIAVAVGIVVPFLGVGRRGILRNRDKIATVGGIAHRLGISQPQFRIPADILDRALGSMKFHRLAPARRGPDLGQADEIAGLAHRLDAGKARPGHDNCALFAEQPRPKAGIVERTEADDAVEALLEEIRHAVEEQAFDSDFGV